MSVSTRSKTAKMEGTLKEIMDMMRAMKEGQDAVSKQLDDVKGAQDAVSKQLDDVKGAQDAASKQLDGVKIAQEEMKEDVKRQLDEQGRKIDEQVSELISNMKIEMDRRFESMEKVVEETVEDFKSEVDKEITVVRKEMEVLNNKVDSGIEDMKKEVDKLRSKCESLQKHGTFKIEDGYQSSTKIKPPTYDGKSSWQTYMKQFDAAAKVNNWNDSEKATALVVSLRGEALEVLQTLTEDKHENYEDLVLHLEMRFGDKHLQQVYQAQLKGRIQRINENLQQYEADIARLVHLAYPTAPQDFIEQLAVQVFIDGIRDCDTQQALRLARCKKLNEVLAYGLEFEAAKQASRGHTRVRQIRSRTPNRDYENTGAGYNRSGLKGEIEILRGDILKIQSSLKNIADRVDQKKQTTSFGRRASLECWNCGEKGHIRPRCPKLGNEDVPAQREEQNQENSN